METGAEFFYVYDSNGNIVRSIDILSEKEYNYIYSEGSLIEAITYDIDLSEENIIGKTISDSICYIYDSEGNLTKKIKLELNQILIFVMIIARHSIINNNYS